MQEQAVRVVHPGFFDEEEEKEWNEDEEEEDVDPRGIGQESIRGMGTTKMCRNSKRRTYLT